MSGELHGRQMLTIYEAAVAVGVSRKTIYNWLESGKIEAVRTAGGQIRIYADTLWRPSGQGAAIRPEKKAS